MYRPVQIFDKNKLGDNIFYKEYLSSAELSEFVSC